MSELHPGWTYENFVKAAPAAHEALLALGKAVDASGLDKALTELIKLRASQINGCAFCIQFHLTIARKIGVAPEKLDLAAAWRDAGIFSDREKAALAFAEALTEVSTRGVAAAAFAEVRRHFSETEALFLAITIGTINQWNRIAIALAFPPPVAQRTLEAVS